MEIARGFLGAAQLVRKSNPEAAAAWRRDAERIRELAREIEEGKKKA